MVAAVALLVTVSFCAAPARADVKLPSMFTDHAVLQRDMPVPVWGWADPGEEITVTIAGQTHKTKADDKGNWRVTLEPLKRKRIADFERFECDAPFTFVVGF